MSLISSTLFAGIKPLGLRFEEGESFQFSLSKFNFSRIYVEGEKIVRVRVPQGTFVIEKAQMEPEEEAVSAGSVYMKPKFDAEITAYFTTDKGHHFSLRVKPDESAGKTIRMISMKPKPVIHWKKNEGYVQRLEQVMNSMLQDKKPEGFDGMSVSDKPFFVQKNLKVQLEKFYRGEKLTGYVYRVQNTAKQARTLKPSLFADIGVKAMVLTETHLNPHQSVYLYSILDESERG